MTATALPWGRLFAPTVASAEPMKPGMAELKAHRPSRKEEVAPAVLAACRAQDPAAFRVFVARYKNAVFAVLARIVGRVEVDDLAQETFLRAYRAFPRFDVASTSPPSTWLLTIAVRLALNERRRSARPVVPLDSSTDVAGSVTPETEVGSAELGEAIRAAVDELPDDQRAAFVLAEYHGSSLAEIAAILEVPEATVKTRLFRARAKMRERLGPWMRDSEAERGAS